MRGEYRPPISEGQVLELLQAGRYKVDSETAEVIGPHGRRVKPYAKSGGNGRMRVRIFGFGGLKTMNRARLVWMSVHNRTVPPGCDIDHVDDCNSNDAAGNLRCMTKIENAEKESARRRKRDEDFIIPD